MFNKISKLFIAFGFLLLTGPKGIAQKIYIDTTVNIFNEWEQFDYAELKDSSLHIIGSHINLLSKDSNFYQIYSVIMNESGNIQKKSIFNIGYGSVAHDFHEGHGINPHSIILDKRLTTVEFNVDLSYLNDGTYHANLIVIANANRPTVQRTNDSEK